MSRQRAIVRREFLRLAALTTGAVAIASCAPASPATPTRAPEPTRATAPATAPTAPPAAPQATKPAAAAPATAPAAAPTTAPAVAATAAPVASAPAAPQATKAAAPKIGAQLIGKLEGPEIVSDPARYPKTFKEAPALADLVKAGKLPPVQERIGPEPLVIKPLQEIGKYGGQWRRGFTGPADQWNARRVGGHDTLLWWDYASQKVVPNVAKGWELAADGKALTLLLRKGLKWSDGQPFTADDIMFWFENMHGDKELIGSPTVEMSINDKPVAVKKVDTYTVRYEFPEPYPYFLSLMASNQPAMGGQALRGLEGTGGYAPAHYLRQYHPKHVAKEELDKRVKDAKFDNWVKLFKFKNDWALNPELPVLTPWKTATPINTPVWTLERNPYSFWVDTEGNQLPYIDKLVLTLAENLEVLNLRAIAGEYDWQERHVDLGKLPVFLENQQKGNYKIYLDPGDFGCDAGLHVNLAYDADPEIQKWFNSTDFRRALSLGINRDQLNETFWLGTGVPGSAIPADDNVYNPGPQYRTLWHTYEPKKAEEMLDKLGLDKKDGEGYRLRTDGKGRLRIEVMTYGGQFMPYTQFGEMVREQLKKIGIDLNVQEVERSLGINRITANEQQIFVWTQDDASDIFQSGKVVPTQPGGWAFQGNPYATWFGSGGKQGREPTGRLREGLDKFKKARGVADAERIKLGKEIWIMAVEEVWSINTVGISPASSGTRVAKADLGNVPGRVVNNVSVRYPGLSRPATVFWKK